MIIFLAAVYIYFVLFLIVLVLFSTKSQRVEMGGYRK